ncbi:radical SAM protein [Ralstonia edaphi]|uniref:radical SAM protein n=1 Tax=Ralstonia edaphi TaxID=3058599 RepID=UPI00292E55D9|nr:radical SAM protein [Ralstonia sp. LMG 6871]
MAIPDYIHRGVLSVFPDSLTIIPTYRCNAQCEQCCFESNPRIKTRLSLDDIKRSIDVAVDQFENLKLVVFSGGEVFLLKDDLYEALAYAAKRGLLTRCVTNAFWGRRLANAHAVADRLQSVGISEINISTGADHQRWVPFTSVEHATEALISKDISTLVTVERDSETSDCFSQATESEVFQAALKSKPLKFSLQCNSWMPFKGRYEQRGTPAGLAALTAGCTQIFHNLVVTPREELAVCCGLTFEHIEELKVGSLRDRTMGDLFEDTFRDFLKIWIHMDGPGEILRKLFGEVINDELSNIQHICQACAILHQHPKVKHALRERYHEFVADVVSRFNLRIALRQYEKTLGSGRERHEA